MHNTGILCAVMLDTKVPHPQLSLSVSHLRLLLWSCLSCIMHGCCPRLCCLLGWIGPVRGLVSVC
uniref:Uncharacterized protein n=1 Tax=Arundo donax TaxID=35708 RepID=A0A0A9FNI1_ARUDO